MSCICAGANFLLNNIADESFTYERQQTPQYAFQSSNPADLYPYLLVTIGSGVSVIKVTSEDSFERIGKKIFYVLFYFTFLFQSFLVRMLIVTLRLYVLKMYVSVCVLQFLSRQVVSIASQPILILYLRKIQLLKARQIFLFSRFSHYEGSMDCQNMCLETLLIRIRFTTKLTSGTGLFVNCRNMCLEVGF